MSLRCFLVLFFLKLEQKFLLKTGSEMSRCDMFEIEKNVRYLNDICDDLMFFLSAKEAKWI